LAELCSTKIKIKLSYLAGKNWREKIWREKFGGENLAGEKIGRSVSLPQLKAKACRLVLPLISWFATGLPDFSWYIIPKRCKNIPNVHKKYKIAAQNSN
jgi:hypothetical protein